MLLHGTQERPITDFLPRIQASLGVVDTDMAVSYLMDAIVQFCRESQLIRRTECIPLEACTMSYLLKKVGPNERFSEVMQFRVLSNDTPIASNAHYYVNDGVLYMGDLPVCMNGSVEIEYTVVPKRDSEFVYDVLYEDWLEPIIHLTLSKLYRLTDMEWVDFGIANQFLQMYEMALKSSRFHLITKHKALKMSLRPKRR